jgi:two-component system sensor histidine kinase KdpD
MNGDARPDPDALLARVQAEEARAARGKLKIFFGASAGVGKTYAMLGTARRQQELGVDVAIGVVETHGRKETEALVAGLERLPPREIAYRGQVLKEFDLDAALARRPALILMDELAHSNVAGSRHPKRWQDIHELLEAGIDVYTTVNVQHLETLNDVVSGIAGIRVWETVPDHVFDAADEVVLVDLPPDELLQRLKEGKVYLPQQAERAIRNFFRKGNLIALRELALRRTADRVDDEMLAYRREISARAVWQTRDALLVCIGPGAGAERLVRTGARLAGRLEAPWHAIHIEAPGGDTQGESQRQRIVRALELAASLGASTTTLAAEDPVAALVGYAREHNLSRLLVGRDHPRPWRPWYRSMADRIGHAAPDLDVVQVARGDEARAPAAPPPVGAAAPGDWHNYLKAAAVCAAATALATPLGNLVELTNIAMLFLLAVLIVAAHLGRGPALAAAFMAVAAFDFFFVPPRFTFAVSDGKYVLTFAVMFTVALIVGQLTARYKRNAEEATRREARARALYEMARDLSAALLPLQVEEACGRFLAAEFGAQAALLLSDMEDRLQLATPDAKVGAGEATALQGGRAQDALLAATDDRTVDIDAGVARWAFDHGEPAGLGTDTLPGSPLLYLPLKAPMRTRGVLAIAPRDALRVQGPEARRQLETFASLVAIAVERMHYVEVAQSSLLQMESESLRNSLLSAISHDLRTPLTALIGLADSLRLSRPPLTPAQDELARDMRDESLRLSAQVANLLDMARLQSGHVRINRQWQPLEEVVGSALKASEAALAGRQVDIRLAPDLPLVEFDAVLIERVLANLLENAAKYTPAGSRIGIGADVRDDKIEVRVEDDGPGLPRGREETLFRKFERGDKEGSTPGVGLGLAICRAIVEAHGGRIRAENRAPHGACLAFTLPRGEPPRVEREENA